MPRRILPVVVACALAFAACNSGKSSGAFKPAAAPELTPTSAGSSSPATTIGAPDPVSPDTCTPPDLTALKAIFNHEWSLSTTPPDGVCGVVLTTTNADAGQLDLEFLPTKSAADDVARYKDQKYQPPKGVTYETFGDLGQPSASSGAALTSVRGTSYFVYLAASNWLVFVQADVPTAVQKTSSKSERNAIAKALVEWAANQQPKT